MEPFKAVGIDVFSSIDRNYMIKIGKRFLCPYFECGFAAYQYSQYDQHILSQHLCFSCEMAVPDRTLHDCPLPIQQFGGGPASFLLPENFNPGIFNIVESVHQGTELVFKHNFTTMISTVDKAFEFVYPDLLSLLSTIIQNYLGILCKINLCVNLEHTETLKVKTHTFYTPFMRYLSPTELSIESNLLSTAAYINSSVNMHTTDGSSWRMVKCQFMEIKCCQYRPQRGGAYIATPKELRSKCIINIKTVSDDCFLLSVVSSLYRHVIFLLDKPAQTYDSLGYRDRVRLKRLWSNPNSYTALVLNLIERREINFNGFFGTTTVDSLDAFEDNNPCISVSVYGFNKRAYPIRVNDNPREKHVDLLLLEKNEKSHFCVVPDVAKLLYGKIGRNKTNICRKCHMPCSNLDEHKKICQAFSKNKQITLPKEKFYEFKNMFMLEDINFKVFYDIYSVTSKNYFGTESLEVFQPVPYAYCIIVVDPYGSIFRTIEYDGDNLMENLIKTMCQLNTELTKIVSSTCVPIEMDELTLQQWTEEVQCGFCKKSFNESSVQKVKHHHHYIPGQVKAICMKCNTRASARAVVFIAHNATTFHHPFILSMLNSKTVKRIRTLAKSDKEVVALYIDRKSNCIDSNSFLSASLDELVRRLERSAGCAGKTEWEFNQKFAVSIKKFTPTQIKEFIKIGELPLTSSWLSFHSNAPNLPFRWEISDDVTGELVTESQYEAMEKLYSSLGCKVVKNFVTKYILARTTLLADVMQHFTTTCMEAYKLYPLHCVSLSQYSYNVAMYMAEGRYENIRDPTIIEFLNRGKRGGMNFSVKKFAQSFTERLGDIDVSDDKRTEILAVDLNSEYGDIMRQYVGCGNYNWMSEEELNNHDFYQEPTDGTGYIFEVDITYENKAAHIRHSDLPLAPDRRGIRLSELSPCQIRRLEMFSNVADDPFVGNGLSLDLYNKMQYVVSGRNLTYYLKSGMRILKIHAGLKFDEKPLFKKFVEKTLELRRDSQVNGDQIGSNLFKVMYASASGKFLSSSSDYLHVEPVFTRPRALKLIANHRFQDFQVISSEREISLIKLALTKVNYNFPLLIGFQIYEHSKLALYKGYERIRNKFEHVRVLAGLTDSLYLEIKDPKRQFIQHLKELSEYFDFSNLDKSEELYDDSRAMEPGLFKIVNFYITEFISIKNSSYSYNSLCSDCRYTKTDDCTKCQLGDIIKGKGIPYKERSGLRHSDFRELLTAETGYQFDDNLPVLPIKKGMFSCVNIHRYQTGPIDSLPFGHFLIHSNSELYE